MKQLLMIFVMKRYFLGLVILASSASLLAMDRGDDRPQQVPLSVTRSLFVRAEKKLNGLHTQTGLWLMGGLFWGVASNAIILLAERPLKGGLGLVPMFYCFFRSSEAERKIPLAILERNALIAYICRK